GPGDRTVVPEGIFDCSCASATFTYGQLVGVDRDATPLNTNQQVVGVNGSIIAIGFVIKREPVAVTKVRCYLSSYLFGFYGKLGNYGAPILSGTGAPTLSAAKGTLYVNYAAAATTTRLYVNTDGATTWASFTASA